MKLERFVRAAALAALALAAACGGSAPKSGEEEDAPDEKPSKADNAMNAAEKITSKQMEKLGFKDKE